MSEWRTAGKVRMTPKGIHNTSSAYNILDLVNSQDYSSYYIAKKSVPANTAITDTEYWEKIVDTSVGLNKVKAELDELQDGMKVIFIGSEYYHGNKYVNLVDGGTVSITDANRGSAFYYITLPVGSQLFVQVKSGYEVRYFLTDKSDGTWTQKKIRDWSAQGNSEVIENGYNVLILNLRKTDESYMVESDIEGCTIFYSIDSRLTNTHTYRYDTVDLMKLDLELEAGDICQTVGYYEIDDGGGAYYIISDSETANDIDVFELENEKYAKIIRNDKIDIRQYGCKANDSTFDNSNRLNYLFSTNPNCTFIPNGVFYFNDTIFTKGNIECSSGGILCANSSMLYGVVLCNYEDNAEMYNNLNGYIRLKVDANKNAQIGVALARTKQANIDVEIQNSLWAAFRDRYATEEQYSITPSTEIENGVFNANENDISVKVIGADDGSSLIGVWINTSDNIYKDIVTKNTMIGVFTSGEKLCAKSVHCWLSNTSMWNDSACFYSHGSGVQLCVNEVYQDTIRFGVLGSGAGSVQYYLNYLNTDYISESVLDQAESYIVVRNRNSIILDIDTYQSSVQRSKIPKLASSGNLVLSTTTKTINIQQGTSVSKTASEMMIDILPYERYRVTISGDVSEIRSLYYYDKFGNETRYSSSIMPDTPVDITAMDFIEKLTLWVDADKVIADGTLTFTVEKYVVSEEGKTTVSANTITPKSPPTLADLNSAVVGGVYAVRANASHAPITTTGNEQLICRYVHGSRSQTLLTDSGAYYRLGTIVNTNWEYGNWIQIGS